MRGLATALLLLPGIWLIFLTLITPINAATVQSSITVTVFPAVGAACGGQPPAVNLPGYTCFSAASDEFDGDSLNLSKWTIRGDSARDIVSGGTLQISLGMDGGSPSGGGMTGNIGLPNAPAYIELKLSLTPICCGWSYEDWFCNGSVTYSPNHCGDVSAPGVSAETDLYETMFSNNDCIHIHLWQNAAIIDEGGGVPTINGCFGDNMLDGNYHILGLLRIPTPSPNGTLIFYQDGLVIGQGSPDSPCWASPSANGCNPSDGDAFIIGYACFGDATQCATTPSGVVETLDYIRVYCPGCN